MLRPRAAVLSICVLAMCLLAVPAQGAVSPHSLREPVTDENFYFVMADRFENGDPATTTAASRGDRLRVRLRPDREGLLPRRRPGGPAGPARLHPGPRHDVDLAHADLQEQGRPARGRPVAPATTATGSPTSRRSTRTSARTPSCEALVDAAHARGHEGLLRHHHQPHGRRDRLRGGRRARPTSPRTTCRTGRAAARVVRRPRLRRDAALPGARPGRRFPYTPVLDPAEQRPQGARPGSTT